jgi:(R,R)-butanediol dehydrogenase/meso-butanediol dehydrogenase/diacetyl reductase
MGHEFAGTVVEIGAGVGREQLGRLVTCGAGVSCGACRPCLAGRTNLCDEYYTLGYHANGGLAEFVTVPVGTVVDAGALGLSADAAGLGQPMSIAVHGVRRAQVRTGSRVLVIGVGGIGAFIVHAATSLGAEVMAVDVADDRLALARGLGAVVTAQTGSRASLADVVRDAGWEPDVVFEVTGRGAVLTEALAIMTKGSRLMLIGIQKEAVSLALAPVPLVELEIIGASAHVCAVDLPEALAILSRRPEGWSDIAPTVRPLNELVSHGIEPLAAGRPLAIKTLYSPASSESRAAVY